MKEETKIDITFKFAGGSKYFIDKYQEPIFYVQNSFKKCVIDDKNSTCRFCGRTSEEVTFNTTAHAIPELLGNKTIILKNECDSCNKKFSEKLEPNLAKFLGIRRSVSQTVGKKGIPKYISTLGQKIYVDDGGIKIEALENTDFARLDLENKQLEIKVPANKFVPRKIYKIFLKMALSCMPYEYLEEFQEAISWINKNNEEYENSILPYMWCIERFIPGVKPLKNSVGILFRKKEVTDVPYCQFIIMFDNYLFQIPVPCLVEDRLLLDSGNITIHAFSFCENFEEISEVSKVHDLRKRELIQEEPVSITLAYENAQENLQDDRKF